MIVLVVFSVLIAGIYFAFKVFYKKSNTKPTKGGYVDGWKEKPDDGNSNRPNYDPNKDN